AAADRHWWQIYSQNKFANGHGYCAAWPVLRPMATDAFYFALGNPYPNPVPQPQDDTTTWFRLASQSAVMQGPLGEKVCAAGINQVKLFCIRDLIDTMGTMHPNELGHQAVMNSILTGVVLPVDIPGVGVHDLDDQLEEAIEYHSGQPIRGGIFPRS